MVIFLTEWEIESDHPFYHNYEHFIEVPNYKPWKRAWGKEALKVLPKLGLVSFLSWCIESCDNEFLVIRFKANIKMRTSIREKLYEKRNDIFFLVHRWLYSKGICQNLVWGELLLNISVKTTMTWPCFDAFSMVT